jgi:hypothetical protein
MKMGIDPITTTQTSLSNLGQAARNDQHAKNKSESHLDETDLPAAIFEKTEQNDQTVFFT